MSSKQRLLNRLILAGHRWLALHGAIAPGTDAAEAFGTFGTGSCLAFPVAALHGERSIHIGSGTLIGRFCTLSVGYTPDDGQRPERGLVIGDRCVIGTRSTITAHESITMGDDVWLGQDVFISDASHGYQDPDLPIGLQFGAHAPVSIGAGTWIGHGAIILPGSQIGRNVVVGAGTVVRGEVEDHAVVVGVPGRVVRRLEPGVGWLPVDGSGDIREVWNTGEVLQALAAFEEGSGPVPPLEPESA